jgi:hypothetical protein
MEKGTDAIGTVKKLELAVEGFLLSGEDSIKGLREVLAKHDAVVYFFKTKGNAHSYQIYQVNSEPVNGVPDGF